jgi:hypothetical protein
MRKAILILLFILTGSFVIAQGYNLQFKSVKTFQLSGTCNYTPGISVATQTLTVDPGTVLKIESASATTIYSGTAHYTFWNQAGLSLDYNVLVAYWYSSNSYTNQTVKAEFPIWLPAGSYTLRLYDNTPGGLSSNYTLKGFVSALEFQLVTP